MGCPLEAFFLGLISTQLLWKGVIPTKSDKYELNAPDHVLVEEGLCVIIPCNFTYKEQDGRPEAETKGFWRKNIYEMSAGDHFQLIGDLNAGNCSLLILKAQKLDTRSYFFRMEKEPKANYNFHELVYLNVTERQNPEIQVLDTMEEGNATNITCATFASCSWMPPNITWNGLPKHINSQLQLNGTQVYSVVNFVPSHADHKRNITCRVHYTNENPSVPRETTVQLNVIFKPRILVINWEHPCSNKSQKSFTNTSQFKAKEGDCIRLHCKVKGNPSPKVTWMKGGQCLNDSHKAWNILTLSDLKPENAGQYTCEATNGIDSAKAFLELSVTEPNKTLVLAVTGVLIILAVIVLIIGIIFASKRCLKKRKTVTDSETGNTLTHVKKPNTSDLVAQEMNSVPSQPRSTHESVDGDPTDPEEIHYATLTFNTPNPKSDTTAEETQTDYAEIRPSNSQRKDV